MFFANSCIYDYLQESSPLKGGRGHASLVSKCKLCSRDNSAGKIIVSEQFHPELKAIFELQAISENYVLGVA